MLKNLEYMYDEYSSKKLIELSDYISENIITFSASWHPLGFVIIKLLKTPKFEYRLHIWPENNRNPKTPNWPIHNHVFDLKSLVLKGEIGSEEIEIYDSKNKEKSHALYYVKYKKDGSDIIDTGKIINIKTKRISWAKKGETYTIKKGVFHQSCVHRKSFSASLVRTTVQEKGDYPLVVGELNMNNRYPCPAHRVDTNKLKELLHQLKS